MKVEKEFKFPANSPSEVPMTEKLELSLFQLSNKSTLHFWRQISSPSSLRIPSSINKLSEFTDPIADEFVEDFAQVKPA